MTGRRFREKEGGPVLHLHSIQGQSHVGCTWIDAMGQTKHGTFVLDHLVTLSEHDIFGGNAIENSDSNAPRPGALRPYRPVLALKQAMATRYAATVQRAAGGLQSLARLFTVMRGVPVAGK